MPTPEDRADALFALPALPRRISLRAEAAEWESALTRRGFEVVAGKADVLVTAGADCGMDFVSGWRGIVVDGDPEVAKKLRAAGYEVSSLLSLPVHGNPLLFTDLAGRGAARYAVQQGISHPERWKSIRNDLVGAALGLGVKLPFGRLISMAARPGGPPALVDAAGELGAPRTPDWVMLVSPGGIIRRNAFLIFERRARRPSVALKFSRVREMTTPFDREQAGYAVVEEAGPVVAVRAPSYLGRLEVDGFHASLETVAYGERLSSALRRPRPTRRKLELLENIVTWLIDVGRRTALPPGALEAERIWFEAEALPKHRGVLPGNLSDVWQASPATFQHQDLAEENVVVNRDGFTVVDWEWAQRAGLPFGDLIYFAAHAVFVVDGEPQPREEHFARLFTGSGPSSKVVFAWVARLAAALDVSAERVGPLVTLGWIRRASRSRDERERAERAGGGAVAIAPAERLVEKWLTTPGLGWEWAAFAG